MSIIDLHCDTILRIADAPEPAGLRNNGFHLDLERMRRGGVCAQFFACFVNMGTADDGLAAFLRLADRFRLELAENADLIAFAETVDDMDRNAANGLMSAFLSIEDGGVLGGNDYLLRTAYRLGVRLITLTWNYRNELGYPNAVRQFREQGLTDAGKRTVEQMNELGMIVDVSHLSDGGFRDVAAVSTKPFVASHSNARAVQDHPRNLTDEMIRTLADAGGVMGLNFAPAFVSGGETSRLEDMVRHLSHIKNVGGSEVLAMGSDFDGIGGTLEVEDVSRFPVLFEALERAGFTAQECERAAAGNARRVLRDTLA